MIGDLRILRIGMQGEDVRAAQQYMILDGYPKLKADGRFGPLTEAVLKTYQKKHGLDPDGIIGSKTWASFGSPLPETPSPVAYRTLAEIKAHLTKGTEEYHEACYKILTFDPGMEASILAAAKRVLAQEQNLYLPFQNISGIPWQMTGVVHSMECNNDPTGCLHNGQRIIGTSKKTTIVPIGRGPFNKFATLRDNWLDAAKDAVSVVDKWHVKDWNIGTMLRQIERFNGTGYINGAGKLEESPYLYARTNLNDGRGKYVSDGKFDPNASADGQVGAAAILKQLELLGEFKPIYLA